MAVVVQLDAVARVLLVHLSRLHRLPPREEPPAQPSAGRVDALVHPLPASFGPEKRRLELCHGAHVPFRQENIIANDFILFCSCQKY